MITDKGLSSLPDTTKGSALDPAGGSNRSIPSPGYNLELRTRHRPPLQAQLTNPGSTPHIYFVYSISGARISVKYDDAVKSVKLLENSLRNLTLLFGNMLLTSLMSRNSLPVCWKSAFYYGTCFDSTWDFYCNWHWTYY